MSSANKALSAAALRRLKIGSRVKDNDGDIWTKGRDDTWSTSVTPNSRNSDQLTYDFEPIRLFEEKPLPTAPEISNEAREFIKEVALRYARDNSLCETIWDALEELGIKKPEPRKVRVVLEVQLSEGAEDHLVDNDNNLAAMLADYYDLLGWDDDRKILEASFVK